jgi:RNA polymerase sigma-70 factor (ECF subfamily)
VCAAIPTVERDFNRSSTALFGVADSAVAQIPEDPKGVSPEPAPVLLARMAKESLEGDTEAARRLLHALAPIVRRTCRGVLGANHPDIEDALQDSLVEIVNALPNYRVEGKFLHYVTKISLRIAIAAKRRSAARSRHLDPLDVAKGWDLAHSASSIIELERAALVRQFVDELPRVQAEAITLRVVLGFSMDETASIVGVSMNTIKTRIRLGKSALRRRFQQNSRARAIFGRIGR